MAYPKGSCCVQLRNKLARNQHHVYRLNKRDIICENIHPFHFPGNDIDIDCDEASVQKRPAESEGKHFTTWQWSAAGIPVPNYFIQVNSESNKKEKVQSNSKAILLWSQSCIVFKGLCV